jgi:predicted dehydrogenase
MPPVRLVTLAPGHFHAALIQKEMHGGIDPNVHVYAPLDSDLIAHLHRIAGFNSRPDRPTQWTLDVHAGEDWRERFLRDRPGNVVVLSGRNRTKIDLMQMAVDAGMHVLADKPWIIDTANWPRLQATLETAAKKGLIVYDVMTERFEITSILQRLLVRDADIFGEPQPGDATYPSVFMESVHYLKKQVAGAPLRRPAWFFDIAEQGDALADVGTHLVDQVLWTLFTQDPIDFAKDVHILDAARWPTVLDREQFGAVTGLSDFPSELQSLRDGRLEYFCNNRVLFRLRGVSVRLDVLWDYEAAPGGGDTHNAVYRGTRSSVSVRQAGGQLPELFVTPTGNNAAIHAQLTKRIAAWQNHYPGVELTAVGNEFQIRIPNVHRTGHEAHFAEVAAAFLKCVDAPHTLPAWEKPHLLTKYAITTRMR